MFNSARLQLTIWYLLIIMVISVAFSLAIYRIQTSELERFAQAQRTRIERRLYGPPTPDGPILIVDPQLISEAEHRLGMFLLAVNGFILIFSGGLSFFLAGRTLKPIREMVDEQTRFIGDASHELRTPLTSLKSAMEVNLRDKSLTIREARSLLADSLGEVNKLQLLAERLLQLTQYQRPENSLRLTKISVPEMAREAIRKINPLAKTKMVTIDEKTGNCEIEGSREGLTDMLVILLDNAVKYSPGKSLVTVSCHKADGSVLLKVADRGIGIAAKDLPHIFDRFYRADSARLKTGAGGYGLGLSIAKKIISAHHGSVKVESRLGKGTVFTVRLPTRQSSLLAG